MKRTILAIVAFVLMLGQAQAQLVGSHRGSEDFKIGVAGYSYRSFDIDQTLDFLASIGVKYFSVKDWWLPLNSTQEQIDAFKAKCAERGIVGYTLGPIYMRSKADVDKTFEYARKYGCPFFIGVPNYDLCDYVIEKVKETGIKVAVHTHGPDTNVFPDIRTVVEKFKDPKNGVGCCMDFGHTIRAGFDVSKDVVTYKDWIMDIHIKDETAAEKKGSTWEMGRGVIDYRPIFKALKKIKYNGVISLEFEKNGKNPHPGVAESIGYIRGMLDASAK